MQLSGISWVTTAFGATVTLWPIVIPPYAPLLVKNVTLLPVFGTPPSALRPMHTPGYTQKLSPIMALSLITIFPQWNI